MPFNPARPPSHTDTQCVMDGWHEHVHGQTFSLAASLGVVLGRHILRILNQIGSEKPQTMLIGLWWPYRRSTWHHHIDITTGHLIFWHLYLRNWLQIANILLLRLPRRLVFWLLSIPTELVGINTSHGHFRLRSSRLQVLFLSDHWRRSIWPLRIFIKMITDGP